MVEFMTIKYPVFKIVFKGKFSKVFIYESVNLQIVIHII